MGFDGFEKVLIGTREREKRFYGDGKGERRRTRSDEWRKTAKRVRKLTRVRRPRTVNGAGVCYRCVSGTSGGPPSSVTIESPALSRAMIAFCTCITRANSGGVRR